MKIEIYCADDESLALLISLTKKTDLGGIHVTHGLFDLKKGTEFFVDKNYDIYQIEREEKA